MRRRRIASGRVGVAERDVEDLRERLDPMVQSEDRRGGRGRRAVVREDGGGDRHDARIERVGVHRPEVPLDRLWLASGEEIIYPGEDDRDRGPRFYDVPLEAPADLGGPPPVDAA